MTARKRGFNKHVPFRSLDASTCSSLSIDQPNRSYGSPYEVRIPGLSRKSDTRTFTGRVRKNGGSVFPQEKAGLYVICL
jgi:hypothetical protein